jgi:hypothetical protein
MAATVDEVATLKALPQWQARFDERANKQISFARVYAKEYHHGADGHNNMMIIAQMADLLDKTEGYTWPADGPPLT